MRYIRKIPKGRGLNEPILHGDHGRRCRGAISSPQA